MQPENFEGLPDLAEVRQAHDALFTARARVRTAEKSLADFEAIMDRAKPRTPWARRLGVDEESVNLARSLHNELLSARIEQDKCQMLIDYMLYAKDMFKARSYREKY